MRVCMLPRVRACGTALRAAPWPNKDSKEACCGTGDGIRGATSTLISGAAISLVFVRVNAGA
jgi:hypothetical protein